MFFYGQTGSGKTYSMFGNDFLNDPSDQKEGVIFRIIEEILNLNRLDFDSEDEIEIEVELSSFQIYFNSIYDLFNNQVSSSKFQLI